MRPQTTCFFEVDEEYQEEVFEAAKENGVTAIYSDGDLRLQGASLDVDRVLGSKFELYTENEFDKERNRIQPLRSVLTKLEPEEVDRTNVEIDDTYGSEKQFGYLLNEEDSPPTAIADGGTEKETMEEVDHESPYEVDPFGAGWEKGPADGIQRRNFEEM